MEWHVGHPQISSNVLSKKENRRVRIEGRESGRVGDNQITKLGLRNAWLRNYRRLVNPGPATGTTEQDGESNG